MTKTGRPWLRRFSAFVLTLAALSMCGAGSVALAKKKEKKTASSVSSPAILAGTVFGGAGFSVRGAEVVVTRAAADGLAAKEAAKEPARERWKAASDARGEFFLRLPAGPAQYNVSVRAPGLKPQEKQVSFTAEERLEQNFLLEPATGGGK
jgi:hypothetical protein